MNKNKKSDPRIVDLSEELSSFILPEEDKMEMYSHRTSSEDIANKIIEEGFKFTESFQKTTDQIVNDLVYLRYWDSLRKHYGSYIIVIGISKRVFVEIMEKIDSKHEVQQALSKILKAENSDSEQDFYFKLPKQYVKGYINRENGEIVKNENYNPYYMPETLDSSIDFLQNQ